jgi:hypothetical protein|tara:strand:+ start:115 stop:282 length:168 start_codon:yes stop_codon:yes gene_type:complete
MTHTSEDRDKLRETAGWEKEESGWYAPHPETGELMHELHWLKLAKKLGLPYPEGY